MKAQRVIGALWLTLFTFIIGFGLMKAVRGQDISADLGFKPLAVPVYLVGIPASAFLMRGAKWARMVIGVMSLAIALLVVYSMWEAARWHGFDGCIGIFAVLSAAILLFPRRGTVAEPVDPPNTGSGGG